MPLTQSPLMPLAEPPPKLLAQLLALNAVLNTAHQDADATKPNLIEGRAFRALSDVQREEIAERISVMGRSSPSGKLLLVQALKKRGHVVAVTGDGTNDAPALNEFPIFHCLFFIFMGRFGSIYDVVMLAAHLHYSPARWICIIGHIRIMLLICP
ncbi:probable cation-transporting ATPase F [Eucalyptus grandis]|uniref:probable cation-transporting ATPase F n=1 Tax=Eucalyptus grandis TaxID=71139 RepID=UPI00192EB916|nr:probable cation-transporting ATPase F [Eucalyptus grandis]